MGLEGIKNVRTVSFLFFFFQFSGSNNRDDLAHITSTTDNVVTGGKSEERYGWRKAERSEITTQFKKIF